MVCDKWEAHPPLAVWLVLYLCWLLAFSCVGRPVDPQSYLRDLANDFDAKRVESVEINYLVEEAATPADIKLLLYVNQKLQD